MKTSELQGAALDWAVAKCEGVDLFETEGWLYEEATGERVPARPSTNWAQGGPIIEREKIELRVWTDAPDCQQEWLAEDTPEAKWGRLGPTPLIAAMRCYVTSKLGDEVNIPEELK